MEPNTITQYRPNCFTDLPTNVVEFTSKEELLSIPWVRQFSAQTNFHQFSMNNAGGMQKGNFLMAEYDEGEAWWVVGLCAHPVMFLPEFTCGI